MKRVAVLGSTGSIGTQALEVIRTHRDRCRVVALAANTHAEALFAQAREFGVEAVCLGELRGVVPSASARVLTGAEGLTRMVRETPCDLVVNAISGAAGLCATAAAVESGIDVAIANKESLVMAGEYLVAAAQKSGARLIPVDSEHSAVSQCLRGGRSPELRRIFLTASGGPFRGRRREELQGVTPEEALEHPTWKMGPKITIDSATLMNKALEIIEAQVLFAVPVDRVEVVIHPESVVHAIVEFHDGSFMAHLGVPDMRIPIQYALSQPDRWEWTGGNFSLLDLQALNFSPPDHETFPTIEMAYRVCHAGGSAPVVFNAANEKAVEYFLAGRIPFLGIFDLVARALEESLPQPVTDLAEILAVDRRTREIIDAWI